MKILGFHEIKETIVAITCKREYWVFIVNERIQMNEMAAIDQSVVILPWRGTVMCPPTYLAAFLRNQYRAIREHWPGQLGKAIQNYQGASWRSVRLLRLRAQITSDSGKLLSRR